MEKRFYNFSSPHEYHLDDGEIIPAHTEADALRWKIDVHEIPVNDQGDLKLSFTLSQEVIARMTHFYELQQYYATKTRIIVFCPLMMLQAMEQNGMDILSSPFRAVRMEDRIEKLVSTTKFCIV